MTLFSNAHSLASIGSPARSYVSTRHSLSDVRDPPYVMFNGVAVCPLIVTDRDNTVKDIIERAVCFVLRDELCGDRDIDHYTLEVNGVELSSDLFINHAIYYINNFDDYELIHHEAIDISVKMIFDQGKVICLPFHGTDNVDRVKHHIAHLYDGLNPGEIRIAYRSDYLDDDEEIKKNIFTGNPDPFLYASVGGSGGGKRKLEDRMVDAHNLVSKNEAAVSPDNQFMTQLQNLHAFVYNNQNVFEEFLKVIPANLAQKLSDAWYGSDQTYNADRLVEIIWNCLCTDYASIQKVEKDANEARKVITSLLTLAYLKQFPDTNGSNCEHETFQAMIDKKMEDFEREVEIQRRVNERLQQQNVQIDDPDL